MGKSYSDIKWTEEEKEFFISIQDPWSIQVFLDSIDYNPGYECRSPRWVIKKKSHIVSKELFLLLQLSISLVLNPDCRHESFQ